ncbi:hypothetical protein [Aliiruegeria lutimaris]|uniref:Ribose transport system permease protein n=1 Tax=Aliiruegeria lutimaris TaxID=571298 RepID=A0A1G8RZ04_9RHOB|nr:hypothetical protein [Aliiruegeria lutimaris]SDJ22179.1 ribose transport system permease protein [Aliiruegeria lutimaris]
MTTDTVAAPPLDEPRADAPRSDWILRYSTLIVLIVMFIGFSLFVDRFLTVFNLTNILQQIAILGIVGSGLTFSFAAKEWTFRWASRLAWPAS